MGLVPAQKKIQNFQIFRIFSKSRKIFAVQNQIRNILIVKKEVNDHKDISNELFLFHKNIFGEKEHLSKEDINQYLNTISKFPQLAKE